MDATDQVLALYERGTEPAVIAEAMQMTVEMVNTILHTKSAQFRRGVIKAATDMADPELVNEMLAIQVDIARHSQNDFLRLAAAKSVRDDLKGRKDQVPTDQTAAAQALAILASRLNSLADARDQFLKGKPIDVN